MKKLVLVTALFFLTLFVNAADSDIFSVAKRVSGKVVWNARTHSGQIISSKYIYTFMPGVPWVISDRGDKIGKDTVYFKDGMIMVTEGMAKAITDYHRSSRKTDDSGHRVAAIFIDPGHGGKDPGAIGKHRMNGKRLTVMEKSVVLDIGRRLKKQNTMRDAMVAGINLNLFNKHCDRVKMANRIKLGPNETILFISIHANASLKPQANGFEVWCLPEEYRRTVVDKNSIGEAGSNKSLVTALNAITEEEFFMESELLAKSVLEGMKQKIVKDIPCRGIKHESWFVVRNAKMPSVLIEVGFVTNPKEAQLLASSSYLQKITDGIYNGVKDFVYTFEHSGKK